ncbi:unnamed protein product [Lactuca saligna]|uniref:Uncharacterized protein n=1 Tax=Lactuca saligna TaxID=75948 RepID=A0AA35Y0L7_LACSI|nr:unnamed protein product [Lactuca saligna]
MFYGKLGNTYDDLPPSLYLFNLFEPRRRSRLLTATGMADSTRDNYPPTILTSSMEARGDFVSTILTSSMEAGVDFVGVDEIGSRVLNKIMILKETMFQSSSKIKKKNIEGGRSVVISEVNASVDENEVEDISVKSSKVKNDKGKKDTLESSRKTQSSSNKEKAKEVLQARSKKSKKTVIEQPKVNLRVKVKSVSKKRKLSDEDDSYFQSRPGSSNKPKRETKVVKKEKKSCCYKRISFIEEQMFTRFIVGCYSRRDIDLSSIDSCDFIVDCLVRTKKVYNPEKESSFVYGPAAYLMEESGGDEDGSNGDEDLCDEDEEDFDVNQVSVVELMIKIMGMIFLNDDENVEDDDQGKCSGGQGGGSGAHEDNVGKNNDLLNEKDDEDDEQGNGSGFNEEESMNLNYVVENVTKSVGLINSQEDVSFSTKNLVYGCIHQKRVEDDVNENLTVFEKNELDDRIVNFGEDDKVIVAKKDGEVEDVEVDLDLGKSIEDFSNKNKDGDGLEIIQLNDSKETQSLKKDKVEGKVENFLFQVLVLDLVKILKV